MFRGFGQLGSTQEASTYGQRHCGAQYVLSCQRSEHGLVVAHRLSRRVSRSIQVRQPRGGRPRASGAMEGHAVDASTVDSIAVRCAGLRVCAGVPASQQDSLELSHWSGTDAGLARGLVYAFGWESGQPPLEHTLDPVSLGHPNSRQPNGPCIWCV